MNSLTEPIVILLLIVLNGAFAMAEIAIISARKSRLEQQANNGDRKARLALDLGADPNRFLSAIQIGITLIGILAGAYGGATIAGTVDGYLNQISWLAPYSYVTSLTLVVLVITYLSLVIGELVPKRLALNAPEKIAAGVAGPVRLLAIITAPVVHILSLSTELVLRLFGIQPSEEPSITEDEIRVLFEQGTEAGVFHASEQSMVEKVLMLDDRRINALMTPRPDVVWLDLDDPVEKLCEKVIDSPYSRFPVCQGDLDNLLGEVHVRDLLMQAWAGEAFNPRSIVREPLYVSEYMPALKVLEEFKASGSPVALVIDEYGSTQGIITLTDILEAIVGDIPSPDQPDDPQAVQREDGSWLVDGMLPIDEMRNILQMNGLLGEAQELYQTAAGFVMMQLEHMPAVTDRFDLGRYRFEVIDMDGPRIDKVLVTPIYVEPDEQSSRC
jgi:putative hemolysin